MASIEFNWNVFPSTKLEETRLVTPLGCMITPFQDRSLPLCTSRSLMCSSCGSYINSHVRLDRINRTWWCPMCCETTSLPDSFIFHEKGCAESEIAPEVRPSRHNTVDYVLSSDISLKHRTLSDDFIIAFVVDLYSHTDGIDLQEFNNLIEALVGSLPKLPTNAKILLITFSDVVEIHQPLMNTSIKILPGTLLEECADVSKLFNEDTIPDMLISRLFPRATNGKAEYSELFSSKILSMPDDFLAAYMRTLKPNFTRSSKPPRATGLAMLLAVFACCKFSRTNSHGKIMAFLGGPATLDPGMIVSPTEHIRSHREVASLKAPHFVASSKFYRALGYVSVGYTPQQAYTSVYSNRGKLVEFGVPEHAPKFSTDIYTGSSEQVGLYEMKSLVEASGGTMVTSESFSSTYFKKSLQDNIQSMSTDSHICKMKVFSSSGIKVMKLVSNNTELQSSYQSTKLSQLHNEKISDTVTHFDSSLKKRNSTNQWHLGSVSCNDTLALFFEMETVSSSSMLTPKHTPSQVFIQFQFTFWSSTKKAMMLRVVTVKRPTTFGVLAQLNPNARGKPSSANEITRDKVWLEGFNAEVWIALLTRLLISKVDTNIGYESFEEVGNDVDRSLIKLFRQFGVVKFMARLSENPQEPFYSISERLSKLATLAYGLRRNPQLISIFNSSPDETAYSHQLFLKFNAAIACTMILPKLYKVKGGRLVNVPAENESIMNTPQQNYFILDCVCHVIIFNHYMCPEERLLLHPSVNDPCKLAQENVMLSEALMLVNQFLIPDRPVNPKIIVTQNGHSQARFLFSRMAEVRCKPTSHNKASWWHRVFGFEFTATKTSEDFTSYYDRIQAKVNDLTLEFET